MNQLLRLLEHADQWGIQPDVYVTTAAEVARKLEKRGRTYMIGECNRKTPVAVLKVISRVFRIAVKEKPDVIITTGSMPLAMLCLAGRLFGAKIVWIDSIANTERFSVSGRLMVHFADLFLTQWPELSKRNPKAKYAGALI